MSGERQGYINDPLSMLRPEADLPIPSAEIKLPAGLTADSVKTRSELDSSVFVDNLKSWAENFPDVQGAEITPVCKEAAGRLFDVWYNAAAITAMRIVSGLAFVNKEPKHATIARLVDMGARPVLPRVLASWVHRQEQIELGMQDPGAWVVVEANLGFPGVEVKINPPNPSDEQVADAAAVAALQQAQVAQRAFDAKVATDAAKAATLAVTRANEHAEAKRGFEQAANRLEQERAALRRLEGLAASREVHVVDDGAGALPPPLPSPVDPGLGQSIVAMTEAQFGLLLGKIGTKSSHPAVGEPGESPRFAHLPPKSRVLAQCKHP
jgi:hypothetical protein